MVYPDGAVKAALTAADGLASPTATAVSGKWLYVTDSGFRQAPHDSKLQRGRISLTACSCQARSRQRSTTISKPAIDFTDPASKSGDYAAHPPWTT